MSRIILFVKAFLSIFCIVSPVFSVDQNEYLIKSMSWKKIQREIPISQVKTDTQAYSLIRFFESSNEPNHTEKIKLLYYVVTGTKPTDVSSTEVNNLLKSPLQKQTTISRLCYWKLYKELSQKKLLHAENKVAYLKKLNLEEDLLSVDVFEETIRVLHSEANYKEVISTIESLKATQQYLLEGDAKRLYAFSLVKTSKVKEGKKTYLSLLKQDDAQYGLKGKIEKDYQTLFGREYYKSFNSEEIAAIIHLLPKKNQKELLAKKFYLSTTYKSKRLIKNVSYTLAKRYPSDLLIFLNKHKKKVMGDPEFVMNLSDNLITYKDTKIATDILDTFVSKKNDPSVYRLYARIFFQLKEDEKAFYSVLNYLEKYPYNLYYVDQMIEFLVGSSSQIKFAEEKYWKEALVRLPNLPIKGRLVYWYFRFLHDNKRTKELKTLLKDFYKLCPGSYYTEVIKQEFAKEISEIELPKKILENRDSVYSFFSLQFLENAAKELNGKDLNFAYHKNAYEQGIRLANPEQKISQVVLKKAVELFSIGEQRYGSYLVNRYSKKSKLAENEKSELMVAIGDLSGDAYLSLYYTRNLMKIFMIPDDPLLLPSSITGRLYPRPHRELVLQNTSLYSVDENMVYAVMRQESFFRESAMSSANAKGLMQVIPSTGKLLAKSLKVQQYSLHDPEISIQFGTKFLADLLKSNNGEIRWATIAYNGGPGNLRKWKRLHYSGDFNHFLENLPSSESRNYCRIVVSNYINYKTLQLINKKVGVRY